MKNLLSWLLLFGALMLSNADGAYVVDNKEYEYVVGGKTNWVRHNITWAAGQVSLAGGGAIVFNIEGGGPHLQADFSTGAPTTLTGAGNVIFGNIALGDGSTAQHIGSANSLSLGMNSTVRSSSIIGRLTINSGALLQGVAMGDLTAGDSSLLENCIVHSAATLSGGVEAYSTEFRGSISAENLFLSNGVIRGAATINGVAAFGGVTVSGTVVAARADFGGVRAYRDVTAGDDSVFQHSVFFRDLTVGSRAQFTHCTINGEYLRVGHETTIDQETTMLVQKEFHMGSSNVFENHGWSNFALVMTGTHSRVQNCGSFNLLRIQGDQNAILSNGFVYAEQATTLTNQVHGHTNTLTGNVFERRLYVYGNGNELGENQFRGIMRVEGNRNKVAGNRFGGQFISHGNYQVLTGNIFSNFFTINGFQQQIGGEREEDGNFFSASSLHQLQGIVSGSYHRIAFNRFGMKSDGTAITNENALNLRFDAHGCLIKDNIFIKQSAPIGMRSAEMTVLTNNVFGVLDGVVIPTAGIDGYDTTGLQFHGNVMVMDTLSVGDYAEFAGNTLSLKTFRLGRECFREGYTDELGNDVQISGTLRSDGPNSFVGFSFSNALAVLANGNHVVRDSRGTTQITTYGVSNRIVNNRLTSGLLQANCSDSVFYGNTFSVANLQGTTGNRFISNVVHCTANIFDGKDNHFEYNQVGLTREGKTDVPGNGPKQGVWLSRATNTVVAYNTVVDSHQNGMTIYWSPNTQVYGNRIGYFEGSVFTNAEDGIYVYNCPGLWIGAKDAPHRNVIVGSQNGIHVEGGDNSGLWIQNNFIGVGPDGETAMPNRESGIAIGGYATTAWGRENSPILIGCDLSPELGRNVVSGNRLHNIRLLNVANVKILGNYFGANAGGDSVVSNTPATSVGIDMMYATNIWIGSEDWSHCNVIAGSGSAGVDVQDDAVNIRIYKNLIGCDASGRNALPNDNGISIRSYAPRSTNIVIRENVISGNGGYGLDVSDGNVVTAPDHSRVSIDGNIIGLDADQSFALPNAWNGVGLAGIRVGMSHVKIGAEQGNVVAGNRGYGIQLSRGNHAQLLDNYVGRSRHAAAFPNLYDGISIGTSSNVILRNSIVCNMPEEQPGRFGAGVAIASSAAQFNTIQDNFIWGHLNKGIHRQPGANENQAAPVITNAVRAGTNVLYQGVVQTAPNAEIEIQLFLNLRLNQAGRAEGENLIDTFKLTANAEGRAEFSFSGVLLLDHRQYYLTATATTPDGSTSEFSETSPIEDPDLEPERPENATDGDNRDESQLIVGDPVDASSGAFLWELPLFNLGGPIPLTLELRYRSDPDFDPRRTPQAFPEAPGETSGYASPWSLFPLPSLLLYGPNADLINLAGRRASFTLNPQSEWVLNSGTNNGVARDYQLIQDGEWFYAAESAAGLVYAFTSNEKRLTLQYIQDRNGNRLSYEYAHNLHTMPTAIADNHGRRIQLEYDGDKLVTLRDHTGRVWTFTHEDSAADNDGNPVLRSITDPMSRTHTFGYQTAETVWTNSRHQVRTTQNAYPLLASITDPRGNALVRNNYILQPLDGKYPAPRVTSQLDARNARTTLSFAANNLGKYIATVTWPDSTTETYVHHSHNAPPASHTDRSGHTIEFARSTNDQITAVKDRLGGVTTTFYHPASRQPASIVNTKGHRTDNTYSARQQSFSNPTNAQQYTFTFHDLVRVDHPDGSHETMTRDTRGNITAHTDPAGHAMTYTVNGRGQILTQENGLGGVITRTYNADGTLATSRDSGTGTTSYTYDNAKRLVRVDHPDGSFNAIAYDALDRILTTTDELDRTTSFEYDANGNLLAITDPAGHTTRYEYDELNRLIKTVDRTDAEAFVEYDAMSRPVRSTDAAGVRLDQAYDPRGWLNAVTEGGNTRTYEHDNEGLVLKETSPLGHETRTVRDASGLPVAITDPLGQTTTYTYDKRDRLASVTDPLGRTTTYARDGGGRITRITLPDGNKVVYAYNALGLLATLTDFNNADWQFGYTPMGRLDTLTDPLDRVTRHTHDNRGRLATLTPPDGIRQTITYDAAGNITRRAYHDAHTNPVAPHALDFTYDENNKLLTANGITFTRDNEGRILDTTDDGLTYRATYDPAGRLASLSYANGALVVYYTYDTAPGGSGRLIAVSNNLTGTRIQLTHDADGRLTSIVPSSFLVPPSSFSHDAASRLTRIRSGNHVDIAIERDNAGRIKSRLLTAPASSNSSFSILHSSFTYDVASQITSPGFTYDPRGRLTSISNSSFSIFHSSFTYDASDRLVAISNSSPIPHPSSFTYNGLGNLRTRTQDGETTHYHYHHAIKNTPILSERDSGSGDFLRHYVWTPDGYLLHMIDATDANTVYFYHFDQIGNTLALTDQNGAVTDSYAYDPYGRLVARSGENPQPFLYSGAWGARAEFLADDFPLYDMRARHYAPVLQRFLTPEPVWPQLEHPLHLNPYQYAAHDPLGRYDATGLAPQNESSGVHIGVRIAFSSRYACPYNVARIQEEIKRRNEVRETIQKLGKQWGWSQQRIDEYTADQIRSFDPSRLHRSVELGLSDPLDLYGHITNENNDGKFGEPEWFVRLSNGSELIVGRGPNLRLTPDQAQALIKADGRGMMNIHVRAVHESPTHGSMTYGTFVTVSLNRTKGRTFEELMRDAIHAK